MAVTICPFLGREQGSSKLILTLNVYFMLMHSLIASCNLLFILACHHSGSFQICEILTWELEAHAAVIKDRLHSEGVQFNSIFHVKLLIPAWQVHDNVYTAYSIDSMPLVIA